MLRATWKLAALMLVFPLMLLAVHAQEGLAGISRAVGIAERSLGARAIEARLETRNGDLVYEIGLVRAGSFHKAFVDARSAQLVAVYEPRLEGLYRRWLDNDRLKAAQRPLAPILTALETHAHGQIHEVELKIRDGRPLFQVEIETANGVAEIELDAMTGKRLSLITDN